MPFVPFQTMALFLYDLKCVRDAFRLFLTDGNFAGSKLLTFYLLSDYPCMSSTSSYFLSVPVKKNFPQIPRLQTVAMAQHLCQAVCSLFPFQSRWKRNEQHSFCFAASLGSGMGLCRNGLALGWACAGLPPEEVLCSSQARGHSVSTLT